MKIFLWLDDEGAMHFNNAIAKEVLLEMLKDSPSSIANINKMGDREFARAFLETAITMVDDPRTIRMRGQ